MQCERPEPNQSRVGQSFVICTLLNLLWNFFAFQIIVILFALNLSVIFPDTLPAGHTFVLDSAEYVDEIYFYGSGPEEIDLNYLNQQWYQWETSPS